MFLRVFAFLKLQYLQYRHFVTDSRQVLTHSQWPISQTHRIAVGLASSKRCQLLHG